jgi:hypothetical protein
VVALLVPTAAVGKEHSCTAAAVVAGTIMAGIACDCPNTSLEVSAVALWVGYTPCGTSEEHCQTHHFQRI